MIKALNGHKTPWFPRANVKALKAYLRKLIKLLIAYEAMEGPFTNRIEVRFES
jgi:hypothetical protein